MLGAIFGDIVGSVYEFHNTNRMDFPLLSRMSRPTDDSIMTLAVADALMRTWEEDDAEIETELVKAMQRMGRMYPDAGYGGRFRIWLASDDPKPYYSLGNGSGMRVSSVGWLYRTLEDTLHVAELTAAVTHNHPEGIRGAQAIAACVFLARAGASKEEIRTYVTETFGYDLSRPLAEIRKGYHFDPTCPGSVPEAIRAFYESMDYEDAIRRAVSLGGDSDTIACMAGAIAEAHYGMPEDLKMKALQVLDPHCADIVKRFHVFCHTHDRAIPDGWRKDQSTML
ncbi:MAG: ADP-ribosylglycohydrolase family protein [Eubacteriales bacterium]|jgi:ADP-ribosylglycohydrolase